MGLTGMLNDGTRIELIHSCEFEAGCLDSHGEIRSCGEPPKYRVHFTTGDRLNACEEHAQLLWDVDEALGQTVEPAPATNAVDPVAQPPGTPTPREAQSSSEGVPAPAPAWQPMCHACGHLATAHSGRPDGENDACTVCNCPRLHTLVTVNADAGRELVMTTSLQRFYNLTTWLLSEAPSGVLSDGASPGYHHAMRAVTALRDELRRDKLVEPGGASDPPAQEPGHPVMPQAWQVIATAPLRERVLLSDGHYVIIGQVYIHQGDLRCDDDEGRELTRVRVWRPLPPLPAESE